MAAVHWRNLAELARFTQFRNQFLASALSAAGSAMTPVALSFGVLDATGSAADLGLVLAAYSAAQIVFMLGGGVWADRLPRKRLMVLSDGISAASQITFGLLLLTGHPPLWAMIALHGLAGAASALFMPASVGLVAETVPPRLLQEANALLSLTRNVSVSVGPMIAGMAVVLAGAGWVLVADGLTFLGSLLFLRRLAVPARPAAVGGGFLRDFRGGWQEVAKRSWVWTGIAMFMIFNFVYSFLYVLGPVSLSGSDNGGLLWGAVTASLGIGDVLGNALAVRFRPRRLLFTGRLMMLPAAPLIVVLGTAPEPIPLIVCGLLAGIATTFPNTLWETALQQHIPNSSLSRVSSFDYAGSFILRPAGLAVTALAASAFNAQVTLAAGAALIVVAVTASLLDRGTRALVRNEAQEQPATSGTPG
ncbi:MFS transporter [Microbispora triticiradicis]|uniref:MFS transporter n=1 Tax=Microbispora triticiradicis TaxID=2200763 RepID=A0ABX9LR76_9ACTN|nr:MFS transporter [Microbispora triticiradicis]RGA06503.1 MFS transporter [Microbispora triticiradicis]GLW22304.1 MFS transporter [Microbispora amethystogenes]